MTSASQSLVVLGAVAIGCVVWPSRAGQGVVWGPGARPQSGRSPRRRRHRRGELTAREDVADLLALLAAPLRSGIAPGAAVTAALAAAGRLHSSLDVLVEELRRRAETGEPLAAVWLAQGERLGSADLRWVGQAWLLTERTGAALAPALVAAEQVLRTRTRAEARLRTVAAGPRASMAILSLLPLGGPFVGAAFGLGPGALYLASPLATASGVMGLALAVFGWRWGRRILARAGEP